MRRSPGLACGVVMIVLAGCAPARPALPSGSGSPFPEFAAAYDEAVAECRVARSVLAELGLSGRAGETKLRGRINAGISEPANIRLEGVGPIVGAVFILAGRDGQATLLLVREDRVVRDASPEAIVEALTGVPLTPSQLLSAVVGCGLGVDAPSHGRTFNPEWAAVDSAGGVTYLRRIDGRWRVGAAVRGDVQVLYADFASGLPSTVHVRTGTVADITLRVSQLEINTPIDDKAFEVNVPPDAMPLTLEELRRAGPLGEGARR